MTLTKDVKPFTSGIGPLHFFKAKPNKNQEDQRLLELWQGLKNWEHELKHWSKEYHALNKIALFNSEEGTARENDSENSFSLYRKAMNNRLPEYQELLCACRLQLSMPNTDVSKGVSDKADQFRQLDQKLWLFKKEINKAKLKFICALEYDMPLSIF